MPHTQESRDPASPPRPRHLSLVDTPDRSTKPSGSPTLVCAEAAGLLSAVPDLRALIAGARQLPAPPAVCVTVKELWAAGAKPRRGGPPLHAVRAAVVEPRGRCGAPNAAAAVRLPRAWR
ncbi:hypothetical protein ACODT4_40625 [Streptomyces sp. 2.9]|uniref:hypothetical protein n=1 Tax=Streptomyces tritrimontium TaxID=3406573 RepID=UPI003BB6CDD8